MKQSVDLMNSMKRFSFRHSNSGTYSTRRTYSTAPTSLARRALLLLSVFLLSFGSAWGEFTPNTSSISNLTPISGQAIVGDDNILVIKGSEIGNVYSAGAQPFYIRFYLDNGSGTGVEIEGLVSKDSYSNNYYSGDYVDLGISGKALYKPYYPGATAIQNETISITLPASHNGYKLFCYLSSTAATTWDTGTATYVEPVIDHVFAYDIITESEATFTPVSESLSETQINIAYSPSAVSLDLYTEYMSTISNNKNNNLWTFYCRWYLRNTNTKELVSATSSTFGNYSSVNGYTLDETGKGLIWSSTLASDGNKLYQGQWNWNYNETACQNVLKNVTWLSPNPEYEVVCVIAFTEPVMAGSKVWKEPSLQQKYVFHMDAPDNFESNLKVGGKTAISIKEHDNAETSSATVDFSNVLNALGGTPKYARFILKKNGAVVDPTGILTITGVTPAIQTTSKPKQGFYLYNSGEELSTSGITVTVNAPDYSDYQVICMLSKDAATAATENVVTQEPEWDLEYTYTFEKVETIPFANLSNEYLQLNKHSEVLSYFGKTEDEIKDSWYGRWSIRNKESGITQPLKMGNTQAEGSWSVYASVNSNYEEGGYLGNAISGNYVVNNSGTELLYGVTSADRAHRSIGYLQVYAPTALVTMKDASDYEIVYEVTDEYTSGTPDFKLRYVFKIPAFENEPNTGMTEDTKPQVIANRSADSFTLGDMPSDAKYARFYLMDRNNNIIEPSTILSVTGGTACAKTESGIYLYNDGSILSPTVKIAASNTYKLYKVVGLFSTALDDINASGTTVNHEPKWDVKWTYTFDYTVTTYDQTPQVEWDATAMEADATTADLDADWNTSLAEMAAGQCIKWWVENGSSEKQSLAIGTARQSGTWTVGLPAGFAVASNVASLSGQTSVSAEQLASWVKTNVYAPSEATYADVAAHKIVCEVYTNNAGTGNPNARYTFSIHKGFVGSLKSGAAETTERVLPGASEVSKTIEVALPTGTKYLRAWLTDATGTVINPSGKLSISGGTAVSSSVENYSVNMGILLYNNGTPLSSSASVTLTLTDATLDQYQVVVVASKDVAVMTSDYVSSEPDWDAKTTYWFKYPAKVTANDNKTVEWTPQSMHLEASNIEATSLGSGYLANNVSHYTIKWTVENSNGEPQNLALGQKRVLDRWSMYITGNAFELTDGGQTLTITNKAELNSLWNNWSAPVVYAPSNMTMEQVAAAGIKFVCRFYEDDQNPVTENLLAFTYTVEINKTEKMGQLKDGGSRGTKTITELTSDQATITDLAIQDAIIKAGFTPKYVRIYLEKSDGTLIEPASHLSGLTTDGFVGFTDTAKGYYKNDNGGISTLPTTSLTLPAGKFSFYHVVVALSKDGKVGEASLAPHRASVLSDYEPDYDYIYTIKFEDVSPFAGTLKEYYSHSKEILLENESVTEVTIPLKDYLEKIKGEYGKNETLFNNLHIRWYITKRSDDGITFEKIPNPEDYILPITSSGYGTYVDQGLFWNSKIGSTTTYDNSQLNVMFKRNPDGKPALTGDWEDYKVEIVLSDDLAGQIVEEGTPKVLTKEPTYLNMLYMFSFFIDDNKFQFVHSQGESMRLYLTHDKDAELPRQNPGDSRLAATVQQYNWNNENSTKEPMSGDFRQNVHKVEYDIYVDPASTTPIVLNLPYMWYNDPLHPKGKDLEPMAYIRWYDWTTDVNNSRLVKVGTYLEDKTEINNGATVSRGYFMLNNQVKVIENTVLPVHNTIGVTFDPSGMTGTTYIACDVSKYYDGIYTGYQNDARAGTPFEETKKPYLMHEPTLSTRYIFRIHPATEIADAVQAGKVKLDAGASDMFELAEDNGRVSLAYKDKDTKFAIRANLAQLDDYYIYNGSALVNCSKIRWFAYYEDETGIYKSNNPVVASTTSRINQMTIGDLNTDYTHISNGTPKTISNAGNGMRFHLVGEIGNESVWSPAVHYEMILLNAPAYALNEGESNIPEKRRASYLTSHMTHQATVNFDGEYGLPCSDAINSQLENHTTSPIEWDEAEYGFCYPDVRRISMGSNDYAGMTPIHGDYIIVRSMNKLNISDNTPHYYTYHWWDSSELYDYTHTVGGTSADYGSFIYVDASHESRTIAKMRFEANLCKGSELCFTGVFADMTSGTGTAFPQMMAVVYAVKIDGTRERVVSFHTSNLDKMVSDDTKHNKGVWYQVYGKTAIPNNIDLDDVDHYEVNIDNYAESTDGADYCVDQLMFFTSNAKMKLKQTDIDCDTRKVKMNLYVDADAVNGHVGEKIYWRFADEYGNGLTTDLYNNSGKLYSEITIPTMPDESQIPSEDDFLASSATSGYFKGKEDGLYYYSLSYDGYALTSGKQYYVSAYTINVDPETNTGAWGNKNNPCDMYSNLFTPQMMYLSLKDGSDNLVSLITSTNCATKEAAITDLNVILNMPDGKDGFEENTMVKYDFFIGTLTEFNEYKIDVSGSDVYLSEAMKDYRGKGSAADTYKDTEGLSSVYQSGTGNYYKVLQHAIDAGKLFLKCSATMTGFSVKGNVESKAFVSAIPTEETVGGKAICSPLQVDFTIDASGSSPQLALGFEDVTYPSDYLRVVRVGKEQLDNMQKTGGFLLHIPVNNYNKDGVSTDKTGAITLVGNLELLAYNAETNRTNDPNVTANRDVATFEGTEVKYSTIPSESKMYISVNFHDASITDKPTFYEGYTYRMFFQIQDAAGGTGACTGSVEFLMKVVPEFVTWQGNTNNWNDDNNWKRSTREELYKDENVVGKKQNSNTSGHPNGYDNNGEHSLTGISFASTPNTFVPMKFTYVTLPSGKRAPKLINLEYDGEGVYNNLGTNATSNIQYDLMVRYTEKTCQDHSVSGDVYDCEKFYGNWAKELYVKDGAELLNQQYLTYEKVWVEKELQSNTWTLMSTPLQNTYAGDMYVPFSNGRQETEAFQPISFNTTTYSRTKYPIYQKGWTQQGVYVWTKTNDVRATKYSANIPGGVSMYLNQWSHVYNDVTVPYSTWTAFAIRPHKKTQTDKTLIRLPKADTGYDYYQWDNTSPTEGKLTQEVSKTTTGKLLTDGTANISGVTYGTVYGLTARSAGDGEVDALVSNIQSSPSNYQLVGNPYLCTINMATFISENSAYLDSPSGYWTYTDNNTSIPNTTGYIGPMQSFFVKVKSGSTEKVVFTPAMMVDGNTIAAPAPAQRTRGLTLTAENENGRSEASVEIADEVKTVETLFDSNLEDVPMVYTVADGQAVSINHTKDWEATGFGVVCNSPEVVEVTLTGVDNIEGELYVVDAVDGKTTEVAEGQTVTVVPNEYGRYFLTRSASLSEVKEGLSEGIMVSVHGGVVSITAAKALGTVRAMSINGATMYQSSDCDNSVQFQLQQGIYVIEVAGEAGNRTIKIVVK